MALWYVLVLLDSLIYVRPPSLPPVLSGQVSSLPRTDWTRLDGVSVTAR